MKKKKWRGRGGKGYLSWHNIFRQGFHRRAIRVGKGVRYVAQYMQRLYSMTGCLTRLYHLKGKRWNIEFLTALSKTYNQTVPTTLFLNTPSLSLYQFSPFLISSFLSQIFSIFSNFFNSLSKLETFFFSSYSCQLWEQHDMVANMIFILPY